MCSTVILGLNSKKLLAENYDFSLDHGLVAVNLKGTIKENGRQPGEKAVRWCVKYGSITFNQFSLELPVSGMNEKGLAVALMWHHEGDYGDDEKYSRLSVLQWIQYQLDNYQNIGEVVEGLATIRPKNDNIPLHYTLLDANGDCLLVEFIDGDLKLQINPEYPILTNSSYHLCLDTAQKLVGSEQHPSSSSIARFNHLYKQYDKQDQSDINVLDGFDWLSSVNISPGSAQSFPWNTENQNNSVTAWSIVFNPSSKAIFFKTDKNESIREVKLEKLDFEKESEYMIMDVNSGRGDVADLFKPYSKEHNRDIVCQSVTVLPMPETEQESLVNMVDMLYKTREMALG